MYITRINKLAFIFYKTALELGESESVNQGLEGQVMNSLPKPNMSMLASQVGSQFVTKFREIDEAILYSHPHKVFKFAIEQLAAGEIPENSILRAAILEFNNGIYSFSNMLDMRGQLEQFLE